MKLFWRKTKIYLAMFFIGLMALFTGVPIIPEEKIEQILQAHNQDLASDVADVDYEQP